MPRPLDPICIIDCRMRFSLKSRSPNRCQGCLLRFINMRSTDMRAFLKDSEEGILLVSIHGCKAVSETDSGAPSESVGRCPVADLDYDSHDPAIAVDPFPSYAKLRASCPVQWSRAWDGYWVATGHQEVSAAARDARIFKTSQNLADGTIQGVTIPSLGQTGRMIPLELDSPECLKYRKLISAFYSPSRIAGRADEFRHLAATCVDEVIEAGACDIVEALTEKLPSILTMRDIYRMVPRLDPGVRDQRPTNTFYAKSAQVITDPDHLSSSGVTAPRA